LFLLIELRAKEAWPEIVKAVTLPGDWPGRLYGDAIHEALPRAVSAMAYDRIEEVVAIIRNTAVDEYVRWAMITGLALCVVQGTRSREEVVALLRGLLVERMLKKCPENALALVLTLIDLYPAEALEEIRRAFDEELVYEGEVSFAEVEQQILVGEEATLKEFAERYGPVTDTVEYLRHWAAFAPPSTPRPVDPGAKRNVPTPPVPTPMPDSEEVAGQVRQTKPRVGRNDPCPCGSGKKFKKCCARSTRDS
jgi:hypothetical protein